MLPRMRHPAAVISRNLLTELRVISDVEQCARKVRYGRYGGFTAAYCKGRDAPAQHGIEERTPGVSPSGRFLHHPNIPARRSIHDAKVSKWEARIWCSTCTGTYSERRGERTGRANQLFTRYRLFEVPHLQLGHPLRRRPSLMERNAAGAKASTISCKKRNGLRSCARSKQPMGWSPVQTAPPLA